MRPAVPIIHNHVPIGMLQPELGQVRVIAHGNNRVNNCSECPAVGGPLGPHCISRAACNAKRSRAPLAERRAMPDKPDKPAPKAKGKAICSLGHIATSVEMAMATDEANAFKPPKQVCRQYMQKYPKGCRFGDNCRGHHYQPK